MAEPTTLAFRAMGSDCRIVLDGGSDELAVRAKALIDDLEQLWSRFVDTSEVSILNQRAGHVTLVSAQTYDLVAKAEIGRRATGGIFNPLMLDQLEAHGYRRSWAHGSSQPTSGPAGPGAASTEPIVLYPEISGVQLPAGTRLDPGGIGKGLAVDLATELCLEAGATTISIELGGDLRVAGTPWYGPEWRIGIRDPFRHGDTIGDFTPTAGAVTTSTTLMKQWTHNGTTYHHLLDPVTGRPSTSDLVAVSTCSSEAWWAEIAAKSALIVGSDRFVDFLDGLGTPGLAVHGTGTVVSTNPEATSGVIAPAARGGNAA